MTPTVRVILGGGLGNQLFMYAAGRALAARTNGRLVLDASEFRRDHVYRRVYLLDRFPIVGEAVGPGLHSTVLLSCERLIRRLPPLRSAVGLIQEETRDGLPVFNADLVEKPPRRSVALRGYWQSERYFRDQAALVRRELAPPPPRMPEALDELARIEAARDPVAVGIRFYHEVPGANTDPAAVITAFRTHLAAHAARSPPRHFTDPGCLGVPFTLITHRDRNEDAPINLHLMSRCRTFFIGYSSYHWWGSWLCPDPRRTVNYIHFPDRPCRDYAAEEWTILPASGT
jgi:hypothetical protein